MQPVALLEPCKQCLARGLVRIGCVLAESGYTEAAIRSFGFKRYVRMAKIANDNEHARTDAERPTRWYPEPR